MTESAARRTTRFIYVSDATAPTTTRQRNSPTEPRYGWRVIAANNRPLGRSSAVFDSYHSCRAAAEELQQRVDDATSSVLFDNSRGHWTWAVALAGTPVAVCVHPYLRRIECVRALRQFVEAVTAGVPSAEGVRLFGARALREYDREAR
ncbi:hypothetical protein [Jatrophihabitans sp.]|uniref:hypothetical protein n=1 Tax=Jatrophihabitans sp. TaxID=1932789 RepID=UPI0030C69AA6